MLTFIELLIRDNIIIDFDDEIGFGYDQAYDLYPCVFPVVTFRLVETPTLIRIAECEGLTDYSFYISLNGYNKFHLDTCITIDALDADNIDLEEDEQELIFDCLDRQCREMLNRSCEELLDEARERM